MQSRSAMSPLAVLCFALLVVTCTSDHCSELQASVDLILAIGPWSSGLAVLTTKLAFFNSAAITSKHLVPGKTTSLQSKEPKLYDKLHQSSPSSTDNLIGMQSKGLLYSTESQGTNWYYDLTSKKVIALHFTDIGVKPSEYIWAASSESNVFFALGTGGQMSKCSLTLTGNKASIVAKPFKLCFDGADKVVAKTTTDCSKVVDWSVKKAFIWQSTVHLLTSDSVYSFAQKALDQPNTAVTFAKVTYKDFVQCKGGGGDSDNKSDNNPDGASHSLSSGLIAVIVIVAIVAVIAVVLFCVLCRQKKDKTKSSEKNKREGSEQSGAQKVNTKGTKKSNGSKTSKTKPTKGSHKKGHTKGKTERHDHASTRNTAARPKVSKTTTSNTRQQKHKREHSKAKSISRSKSKRAGARSGVPTHWDTK